MSDRFPAEITIGGTIPRQLMDELAGMIASEGVSLDWQYAMDKASVFAAIEAAACRGETVRFTDDEACLGQFEDLENWLTSHGIDFDRHSDARYEYDGENAYGRSRKRPVIRNSDQSGKNLVSAEEVHKVLASQAPPDRKLARIAKLAAVPPVLTPIVLTDGKGKNHDQNPTT
jgi:aspartate oxidase